MPILDFDGNTFVAFLDISGFKKLMDSANKAWVALDKFYNCGYRLLREQAYRSVEGIFVSDSGILFVRNGQNQAFQLRSLLSVLREINRSMLTNDFMLTTSIAYGYFRYQDRIEFEGIDKTPIYGNAYVDAFFDNERGTPKIQPGQCRIINQNLTFDIMQCDDSDDIFKMVKVQTSDHKHYYFYWMRREPSEIEGFEKAYQNSKYYGLLKALKGA